MPDRSPERLGTLAQSDPYRLAQEAQVSGRVDGARLSSFLFVDGDRTLGLAVRLSAHGSFGGVSSARLRLPLRRDSGGVADPGEQEESRHGSGSGPHAAAR